MDNLRVAADAAFREELTSQVDGIDLKSAFEQRYGRRGWQRKLGAVLDVPETTVNGWFKFNKFPTLATLAFGALLSRATRPPQRWLPVRNGSDMPSATLEDQSVESWRTISPTSTMQC